MGEATAQRKDQYPSVPLTIVELASIASQFIPNEDWEIERIGSGHINTTYHAHSGETHMLLQRLNTEVFSDYEAVSHNLLLMSQVLKGLIPKWIPTTSGEPYFQHEGYWRAFQYENGVVSIEEVNDKRHVGQAGHILAQFYLRINTLSPQDFKVTIPSFHDLPLRYEQFLASLEKATSRLKGCQPEVDKALSFASKCDEFREVIGGSTLHLVHNDPKLSNVLFSPDGKAEKVIDLDTVMPGYLILDFGDMVRSYVPNLKEDDPEVDRLELRIEFLEQLVLSLKPAFTKLLSPAETLHLFDGALFIIYEQYLRFLADYLNGDVYYRVEYPEHNLVRARNQLAVLEELVNQERGLRELIMGCTLE